MASRGTLTDPATVEVSCRQPALTAITRHVDDYAARARLPRAAGGRESPPLPWPRGQLLSGEQPLFTLPGLFGEFLGPVSGGDLGIDFSRVGGPVPDGGAQQPHRYADVAPHHGEQVILGQPRLIRPGGFDRADGFPDIGAASQTSAPPGGTGPEHDAGETGRVITTQP